MNSRKIRGPPLVQEEENLALTTQERLENPRRKEGRKKPFERKSSPKRSFRKDRKSKIRCFSCNRKGHYARECPNNIKKKHHAHAVDVSESEEEDHEEYPPPKKNSKSSQREESKREFFFVLNLQGSISPSQDTWLIDSGASRHMKGDKDSLSAF